MTRRRRGLAGAHLAALVGLIVLAATGCGAALESEVGLVVAVDSPSIGRADGFQLRTEDGEMLTFDTTDLEFRQEFPAAHLVEHQRTAERVRVTYRRDGDRRVVVRLADGT